MSAAHGAIIQVGEDGCFACAWWDSKAERPRIAVAYVGEDGIKPNTKYQVNNKGKFIEVKE